MDYWGEIDGHTVGVAIFDHPDNPRHPTWWHARDYGLVAANPFGIHNFEEEEGGWHMTIKKGEKLSFRYAFLFHEGDAETAGIASFYDPGFKPWQPSRRVRLAIADRGQTILQEFIFAAGQVNNWPVLSSRGDLFCADVRGVPTTTQCHDWPSGIA